MCTGIAIIGLNGSGKTSLGKELAKVMGYKHMDVEDYYFEKSEVPYANPYVNPRTKEEVQELMLSDIKKYGKFVLSSVNCDYGEEINDLYKCAVYIKTPLDVRLDRVRKRSVDKYGSRVLPNGDMYEQEQRFYEFVAARTMDKTKEWLNTLDCPVICVDGTLPIKENIHMIKEQLVGISQ